MFWVSCGVSEDLFHLNCGCQILVDARESLSCGDVNVGSVDAMESCSSNLQLGSNLSGVLGWMLYCICACVTNIL